MRHAAPACGIHFTTAYDWLNRGDAKISEAKLTRPMIEAELADWLLVFPDNFDDTNPMWDAPAPTPFENDDEWHYVLFAVGMRKAQAQAVADAITDIREAGKKDWKARAWWLERTHPDMFGRQQTIQHSGPQGGPLEITAVDPAALADRLRELKIRRNAQRGDRGSGE